MIPQCVNDLCLDGVFKSYSSSVESFLLMSIENEHIVDSAEAHISGFVSDSFGQKEERLQKYFEVNNPMGQEYVLFQIDNGIIRDRSIHKCDCAIANEKDLCLIEFKTNAYSNKLSEIHQNYKKAIEQLSATIRIFETGLSALGKDFYKIRSTEAFVCFKKGYPKKTSTQMNYQVSFAKRNKGIHLSFERKKIL